MEKSKLQELEKLREKANFPEVPGLKHKVEGEFFRISIYKESNSQVGAGIAYSNEMVIEKKKIGGKWERQYSTGNYEIDDWDMALDDVEILLETKETVIYALMTSAGNIKVYDFENTKPKIIVSFGKNSYEYMQQRRNWSMFWKHFARMIERT
ncbi:MAG: hypothetical protein U9Q85_00365 [Patescibacteria group bacterium]|nr:hypothetical protein [Patescibacteria group bacterium]